jgi:hypothetical protein
MKKRTTVSSGSMLLWWQISCAFVAPHPNMSFTNAQFGLSRYVDFATIDRVFEIK